MRIYFTILSCILYQSLTAQFAIVSDKDGFVNVRSSANACNNIIDKLSNGAIVFCLEPESDWLPADYDLGKENKSGYIHKSRVVFLENFKKLARQTLTDSSAIFKNDSLTIRISKTSFFPGRNKLQYHKGNPSKNVARYLERINGKEIWGTDGNIPKKQYGQIVVQFGRESINLPVDNLFEPNLDQTFATIDKNGTVYLSAINSDGAGGYAVLWVIERGNFKRRITTIPF